MYSFEKYKTEFLTKANSSESNKLLLTFDVEDASNRAEFGEQLKNEGLISFYDLLGEEKLLCILSKDELSQTSLEISDTDLGDSDVSVSGISGKSETDMVNAAVSKKSNKTALIVIAVIAIVAVIMFALSGTGKSGLKKSLVKKWYDTTDNLILVLDFTDDNIKYYAILPDFSTSNIGTMKWKTVDDDTIEVTLGTTSKNINVKFNDDGNSVTFYPSIPSTESSHTWVHIENDDLD